ncbi:hypothetical protein MFUL124B02_23975 [Myxococcus fulvus 124B02]|nr:hypothetical protein MFUL124B02_23975 [Myxococcus fulvus 124B02]
MIPDFGLSALGEDAPAPQMPCNKCRIAFVTSFL